MSGTISSSAMGYKEWTIGWTAGLLGVGCGYGAGTGRDQVEIREGLVGGWEGVGKGVMRVE